MAIQTLFIVLFCQAWNDTIVKLDSSDYISIYVLPKQALYPIGITVEEIRSANDSFKRTISASEEVFSYLVDFDNFLGAPVPGEDIDVRLLVDVHRGERIIASIAFSGQGVVQVDNDCLYRVENLKPMIRKMKTYIPKKYHW